MPPGLNHEVTAASAFANLATLDIERAKALLDQVGVQAQDFTGPVAKVWAVLESMVRDGRVPDFFSVEAKCPGVPRQLLSDVLLGTTIHPPRGPLEFVRDAGQRRRLAAGLETVRGVLLDPSRPISDAVAAAQGVLNGIREPGSGSKTLDSEVLAFLDVLDEVAKGNRQPVLATGIAAVDEVVGGLQPTLTVVGALPGVGKSALVAAIVRNLSRRSVKVGVFSLEDERDWLVKRLLAEATGIPVFVLQNRPLTRAQQERVAVSMEQLHRDMGHVVVDDRPALTPAEVVSSAREMLSNQQVKALLVDHLGEIRLTRSDRHDLDIADCLQQLRALAKTYRVPVVVACHLRRREGLTIQAEPKLTDFAFSAAVERMARVALALSKPSSAELRVHVLKQTNGIANVAPTLEFDGPSGLVKNAPAPETRAKMRSLYGVDD